MHETLKRQILRQLETLPEAQLYQVLDYPEFMESRYSQSEPIAASGIKRLAERLEDGLRSRTLLRESFQLRGCSPGSEYHFGSGAGDPFRVATLRRVRLIVSASNRRPSA